MARKAVEAVNNTSTDTKTKTGGKQDIKALPLVFANEEQFRAHVSFALLLSDEKASDSYNATLADNKLLTVKQSITNYKMAGIELEKEFYPYAVNVSGLYCGINRRQRTIFAVGFIGNDKFAFTVSTRANKPLPELKGKADDFGYAPKYLNRLAANSGVLLPCTIDFNHFVQNNFGLPYCYTTSTADILDYNQWVCGGKVDKFKEFKKASLAFEGVDYDAENCISQFVKTASENGFVVFQQDYMKIAFDYADYLTSVIDGENFSAIQKAKALHCLKGTQTVKAAGEETQQTVKASKKTA